jgi:urea transport system permease protein
MVGVVPSIEMVIAVAVGGRSSLMGVVLGTLLVNFGKDAISTAIPELWQFVMGTPFILIVTALPKGLVSLPNIALRLKAMVFKTSAPHALEGPNV